MKEAIGSSVRNRASRRLLDRSILLDEREGPPLVRNALLFGTLVVSLFLVWASAARLEEIETASGEIVPADEARPIQHSTGGVVVELPVREGSAVKAGDLLVRLDPADTDSVRQQTRSELYSLYTLRERLSASLGNRSPDFSGLPSEASVFIDDQRAIFLAARTQINLALDMSKSQAEQAALEYEQIEMSRAAVDRELAKALDDVAMIQNLVESGSVARAELTAKQRLIEDLKDEIESLSAKAKGAKERAAEYRVKLDEYRAASVKQLRIELASANERIGQAEEQQRRLENSALRLDVVAPVDGIVHALKYSTLGAIAPSGAVLMELIPTGKLPKAQIRIDPKSIGSIKVGNGARIKVSAYPYDRFGAFTGTLAEISASTFTESDGRAYYRGIVTIEGRELADAENLDLVAGMTLTADLRTGEKTLMQYLLKPIFASAREAFREK